MNTAIINRPSRIQSGHLWVFSNELTKSPKHFEPGSLVELNDKTGNFLGIGYVNPHSLIAIRVLTREQEAIDEAFFRRRITDALKYRRRFFGSRDAFRAVYSESDLLPGLIVDKYGDCLSIQFQTMGMEVLAPIIIKILDEVFSPSTIVLRNDSPSRTLEGLPLEKKIVKGSLEKLPEIHEDGITFVVDPMAGQKTGFFLDQAENRAALSALVKGNGSGLDLFCYSGAWSIKAASNGASVKGVDSSENAIAIARRNSDINGLTSRCDFLKADVFDFVKAELREAKRYDFIILDPPAFVKSKTKIKEGLRAYRDLNAQTMALLKSNGLLATSSCSHHVERTLFMEMLKSAARDAGRHALIMEMRSQAKDHPISLSVPETEYLKCFFILVR